MNNNLTCSKCKQEKPVTEFYVDRSVARGYTYQCKECRKVYKTTPQWYVYSKNYHKEHPNKSKENAAKRRRDVIEKLGGKCECCGETEFMFLAIDHIHGLHHRGRKESGNSLVTRVKRSGYDKKTYRVLCHNCNSAIGWYGFCPHHNLD